MASWVACDWRSASSPNGVSGSSFCDALKRRSFPAGDGCDGRTSSSCVFISLAGVLFEYVRSDALLGERLLAAPVAGAGESLDVASTVRF
jgi:hypothetical protein